MLLVQPTIFMRKNFKRIIFTLTVLTTLGFGLVSDVYASSYMKTTCSLNVRTGASTKYKKLGTLKKGAKVIPIKTRNGWCKIKYGNRYGWCKKSYLSKTYKTNKKNVKRTLKVKAYAYTGHSMTSTGKVPKAGRTIAVDPRIIPYGSKIYIPALGRTYIAEDCGGGIKGNKVDIYMSSNRECYNFGVKYLTIHILN